MVKLLFGRICRASRSSHSARILRWGTGRALYFSTYYGYVWYLYFDAYYDRDDDVIEPAPLYFNAYYGCVGYLDW